MEPLSKTEVREILRRQGFQPSADDLERVNSRWQAFSARLQHLHSLRFDGEEIAGVFSPTLPAQKES